MTAGKPAAQAALKGSSSYCINHEVQPKGLEWQRGYGIVTFGTKDLQWVIDYVNNQKDHHRNGTVRERLERIGDPRGAEGRDAGGGSCGRQDLVADQVAVGSESVKRAGRDRIAKPR